MKDQSKTARIISALSEKNQVQVREMEGRGRYYNRPEQKGKCKLYSLECEKKGARGRKGQRELQMKNPRGLSDGGVSI